ncbi:MAG: translation initiation factor IF-3 [Thermoguttaceae bacterium]|nr:translation initiation factor IF-3 [Thermoguttaceae bacterium]
MDSNGPRPGNVGANKQRVNEMIRVPQILVISEKGEQLGVMSPQDALARARSVDLDLVEVAPQLKPPVCRIMDYGKFKYQQRKRVAKQQTNKPQIKELRLRPKTGIADVEVKVNKCREFLGKDKDKVILSIVFRGRESAHVEEGEKLMRYVLDRVEDVAKIESPPRLMGKRMICTLAPK